MIIFGFSNSFNQAVFITVGYHYFSLYILIVKYIQIV